MDGQFKLNFEQGVKRKEESPKTKETNNSLDYLDKDLLDELYSGNDNADEMNRYKK